MKKKILITSIFLIFVSLFMILLLLVGGEVKKSPRLKESPLPSPVFQKPTISLRATTSLSLSPKESIKYLNDVFQMEILIDTGKNVVSGVELYLFFDPEKLEVENVEPGNFFENPNILLNETDQEEGAISFALGTFSPKSGVGSLATLTFRAIGVTPETQPTTISFMETTKVAEVGEIESVLAKTEEARFILLPKSK